MLSHFFSTPQELQVSGEFQLRLSVPEHVSDFVVAAFAGYPILEWIVIGKTLDCLSGIMRIQPFMEYQTTGVSTEDGSSCTVLLRGIGQGLRLYPAPAISQRMVLDELRHGISLVLWDDGSVKLQSTTCLMVPLEQDRRIITEPEPVGVAKQTLADVPDYSGGAIKLAVQLAELLQASYQLDQYYRQLSREVDQEVTLEINRLLMQLEQKRQWLLHCYHQALNRPNFASSANQLSDDKLQRLVDCYELLAPPELSAMVAMLTREDS